MGTSHDPSGRTQQVNIRLSEKGLAKIDEVRGVWSRSEYVRQAVALAVQQGKRGPEQIDW